jgi:hypothetical protein
VGQRGGVLGRRCTVGKFLTPHLKFFGPASSELAAFDR